MDFDKIVLLPRETKLLKKLFGKEFENLENEPTDELMRLNFISVLYGKKDSDGYPTPSNNFYITDLGNRYLNHLSAKKKQKFFSELRGWITTVIAVLAFFLSVYSICLQYGNQP